MQNFLTGQYGNALRVVAFNTAEGWSWDVSEDIANEILQRAVGAYKSLSEATLRFVDRHIADLSNPTPKTPTSPIDLIDSHKGTSNNDDFVVGLSAAAMSLLIWRGCASASCARRPIQGASGGLLRHAMAIRSSVTSRRML